MTEQLCARIIDLIPSESLKSKMRELGFRLSDKDLLSLAFQYAPDYETRLRLLTLLEKDLNGPLKDYAARLLRVQRRMLEDFRKSDAGTVFELYIQETPDAYEEKYLCASCADALAMIPLFYQAYEGKEQPCSRYTVKKRRVLSASAGFAEDELGVMELLPGPKLASVELFAFNHAAEDCDGSCLDCERCCVHRWDTVFPCFVGHGDAVKYTEGSGKTHFGIAFSQKDAPTEAVYVIPLDSDEVRLHDFENVHRCHTHVLSPLAERIDAAELPEPLRADYEACRDYMMKRWPNPAQES